MAHIAVNVYNRDSGLIEAGWKAAFQFIQRIGDQQIIRIDLPCRAAEQLEISNNNWTT